MNGYLLDSNIAIAILMNEPNVINFVCQAERDKVKIYFSVITECEVLSGLNDKRDQDFSFVKDEYDISVIVP